MINKRRLNNNQTFNTNAKNPFLDNNTTKTSDNNSVKDDNNLENTIVDDTNSSVIEDNTVQLEDNTVSPTVDDSMLGSYDTDSVESNTDEAGEAEENNTTLSKKWLTVGIIAAILACCGVGGAILYASQQHNNSKIIAGSTIGGGTLTNNGRNTSANDSADKTVKFMQTLGVPAYYTKNHDKLDNKERVAANTKAIRAASANASLSLPSKQSNPNLTDDPRFATTKDGRINPDYSYITMENVMPLIRDDVERLINPVYGNWEILQFPAGDYHNTTAGVFSDMLTTRVTKTVDLQKVVNLYADWNRDFYNDKFLDEKYDMPIVGRPTSLDCEFNINGNVEDNVTCYTTVDYYAKYSGVKKKVDSKTMTLRYKVNYAGVNSRRLMLEHMEQK
jgi:hypothetical protein